MLLLPCFGEIETYNRNTRNNRIRKVSLCVCRIRTEKNGGAWCPKAQITRDVYEWIQVDLGELKVITQVETQGRFGNGQVSRLSVSEPLD